MDFIYELNHSHSVSHESQSLYATWIRWIIAMSTIRKTFRIILNVNQITFERLNFGRQLAFKKKRCVCSLAQNTNERVIVLKSKLSYISAFRFGDYLNFFQNLKQNEKKNTQRHKRHWLVWKSCKNRWNPLQQSNPIGLIGINWV